MEGWNKSMNVWTLAILPLIGVVLGAGLQFLLTRATARDQQTATLRFQAYADYLRAVAMAGHLRSDEDLRDAHRDAADAKARIAVYGTVDVIKAMARFEEFGLFSLMFLRREHLSLSFRLCDPSLAISRSTNWNFSC